MGGLGNQMFQYAYARNLSISNQDDFYLDISFYNNQLGVTPRIFSLNLFPNTLIEVEIPPIENIKIINDNFKYNPTKLIKGNYLLQGYWQSEKYFKNSKEVIINDFSPNETNQKKLLKKYPTVVGNSVSLHIRRTDYLTSNGYHPVQTIDYYSKAIDILDEYENIFIFSDDIEWCKNNLNFNNMVFVEGNSDVEDLWLMSLCKNNIIVNSSFSWWGAYLNKNVDKVVIAPSKWFGDSVSLSTEDIVPEQWNKI
tara:strand:+ start:680 stop:1438 length:759 start_codon:yes stop_codon:yes gene_type:complete